MHTHRRARAVPPGCVLSCVKGSNVFLPDSFHLSTREGATRGEGIVTNDLITPLREPGGGNFIHIQTVLY